MYVTDVRYYDTVGGIIISPTYMVMYHDTKTTGE